MGEKDIIGRGKSKCKGPGADENFVGPRNSKKYRVAGVRREKRGQWEKKVER